MKIQNFCPVFITWYLINHLYLFWNVWSVQMIFFSISRNFFCENINVQKQVWFLVISLFHLHVLHFTWKNYVFAEFNDKYLRVWCFITRIILDIPICTEKIQRIFYWMHRQFLIWKFINYKKSLFEKMKIRANYNKKNSNLKKWNKLTICINKNDQKWFLITWISVK